MSLSHAPLALIDRLRGRHPISPDDPLVHRLTETLGRLQPDPLFRRRLRGEVVNRFLAASEARAARSRRRRGEMGRLGRAVLYASFALVLSVTAVGAAAQQSLPGDALYGVKLRLEALRVQIAPPSMRPQLAAMALDQRLEEVEQLATRGDWRGVQAASGLVDQAASDLAAYDPGPGVSGLLDVERHTAVLDRLAADAPPAARHGLEQAIAASSAATDHARGNGNGNGNVGGNGNGNPASGSSVAPAATDAPGKAGGQSANHQPTTHPSHGTHANP
jgi:hypothetical protein